MTRCRRDQFCFFWKRKRSREKALSGVSADRERPGASNRSGNGSFSGCGKTGEGCKRGGSAFYEASDAFPAQRMNPALPHASPSVRRYARELGVDLRQVTGSGPKERILKEDVQAYVKAMLNRDGSSSRFDSTLNFPPWPSLDFSQYGETELQPLSRIKKISGPNLHRNWVMIPHVTQYEQADVTDIEAFRKATNEKYREEGVKLTVLAFVIKACVAALKKYPEFNASLDATGREPYY